MHRQLVSTNASYCRMHPEGTEGTAHGGRAQPGGGSGVSAEVWSRSNSCGQGELHQPIPSPYPARAHI